MGLLAVLEHVRQHPLKRHTGQQRRTGGRPGPVDDLPFVTMTPRGPHELPTQAALQSLAFREVRSLGHRALVLGERQGIEGGAIVTRGPGDVLELLEPMAQFRETQRKRCRGHPHALAEPATQQAGHDTASAASFELVRLIDH